MRDPNLFSHEEKVIRDMLREIAKAEVYTREELVPLPAICMNRNPKRRHEFVGIDAIKAPALRGCRCFYCGAELKHHPAYPPVEDAETKRMRIRASTPHQLSLIAAEEDTNG